MQRMKNMHTSVGLSGRKRSTEPHEERKQRGSSAGRSKGHRREGNKEIVEEAEDRVGGTSRKRCKGESEETLEEVEKDTVWKAMRKPWRKQRRKQ